MQINGITLTLNVGDAEEMRRYEQAVKEVYHTAKNMPSNLSYADSLQYQCQIIFQFFDHVFGEGSAIKVFGDHVDVLTCLKLYQEVFLQVNHEREKLKNSIQNLSAQWNLDSDGAAPKR